MSADHPGAQNVLAPIEIRRQDSDTSGCSSIADSPIYAKLTGKLISHEDMEFEKTKKLFFNAALRRCNPKAFAVVETIDDIKSAIKYCQDSNVSQSLTSVKPSDISHPYLHGFLYIEVFWKGHEATFLGGYSN